MQGHYVKGISEGAAAKRVGLSQDRLKKKRQAGEVPEELYQWWHGYAYNPNISLLDIRDSKGEEKVE